MRITPKHYQQPEVEDIDKRASEAPTNVTPQWPSPASLATVKWIGRPHPAVMPPTKLLDQCQMNQLRRSGPGGQHRNKVSTAILWLHRPTGIRAEASESREQSKNRQNAFQRLRLQLAICVRSEQDHCWRETLPSGTILEINPDEIGSVVRRTWSSRKLKISSKHEDFPSVMAIVLDDLHLAGGQPSLVGPLWKASTTAVVTLIASDQQCLAEVNRWRRHHDRKPLHA